MGLPEAAIAPCNPVRPGIAQAERKTLRGEKSVCRQDSVRCEKMESSRSAVRIGSHPAPTHSDAGRDHPVAPETPEGETMRTHRTTSAMLSAGLISAALGMPTAAIAACNPCAPRNRTTRSARPCAAKNPCAARTLRCRRIRVR